MPQKAEVLHQGIVALGGTENIQQTEKKHDKKRRPQLPANKSIRGRLAVAQLRDADGGSEKDAIKNVNLITRKRAPEAELLNESQIASEMIKGVAETGCGKYCTHQAKLVMFLEEPKEEWVEKNVDEQFLKIEIVAIEKFRDGAG
jgi:hypothetical protein